MAAAMALTGFGQSPSAPPATNSLLTPIRQQQEDEEDDDDKEDAPIDIDLSRAKRNISFYEEDDRASKRQNIGDYTRVDDEALRHSDDTVKYGQGVYGTHHSHHHQHGGGRNIDRVDGPDGTAEGMVATEVAYV
jgi:hypothetical protein